MVTESRLAFFPLSVINWKTAIKLLLARNVILIKAHDDQYVRSPSISIELPSILMLKRFHKFHNYVKFSRSNVFLRGYVYMPILPKYFL